MHPETAAVPRISAKRKRTGIWLIIGPTVGLIGWFIVYVIAIHLVPHTVAGGSDTFFGPAASPAETALNTLSFLIGTLYSFTFLPSIIAGIIVLNTGKK